MKLINQGLVCLSIGVALMASSCANESPWDNGIGQAEGRIDLNLLTDSSVQLGSRAEEDADGFAMQVDPSDFSINLKSVDGSYDRTWESLEAFNKTPGFPQGAYTLKATYGSLSTEGFECPYYVGSIDLNVLLGETISKTVTASLNNAMVSVRYTDEFASLYPNGYSAEVKSIGNNAVPFVNGEKRPGYFAPGQADFFVNLTNSTGQTVRVNPTSLNLSAKHHYVVTVGVNLNNQGQKILDISVTENIIEENPIEINLSDDLFTKPEPEISVKGFVTGTPIEGWVTDIHLTEEPEIHVMALAGIASAKLTLTASNGGKLPVTTGDVYVLELVNPDASGSTFINESKLSCNGFSDIDREFAVVNFSEYIKNLPQGDYTASLVVKDGLGRPTATAEGLEVLSAKLKQIEYNISATKSPAFFSNKIEVTIESNCQTLVKEKFHFNATDSNREVSQASFNLISGPEAGSADGLYKYVFEINTVTIDDNQWTIQAQYDNFSVLTEIVKVNLPQFTVATDAFAKRVKIKFENEDPEISKLIAENINLLSIGEARIDRSNASEGIITVTGLEPLQTYSNWIAYLGSKTTNDYPGTPIESFTTEEKKDVPNVTTQGNHLYFEKIQCGGQWGITGSGSSWTYTNWAVIDRYEPLGWITLNSLTCSKTAIVQNTWFVVPSTYIDNNEVVIRTVGYHDNGPVPKRTDSFLNYYNTKAPDELLKSVGKLWWEESSIDGTTFVSRPQKITFDFSYNAQLNNGIEEQGLLNFIIMSNPDEVLIKKEILLSGQDSVTVNLDNYEFGKKAQMIKLEFVSSNSSDPTIIIPRGSDLEESGPTTGSKDQNIKVTNGYHALATGSELRVSNVHIVYE